MKLLSKQYAWCLLVSASFSSFVAGSIAYMGNYISVWIFMLLILPLVVWSFWTSHMLFKDK